MNRIKKYKTFIAHIMSLFFLSTGCAYDEVMPVEIEDNVSFKQDLQPFFNNKCTSCHADGTIVPLDLSPSVAFDQIISGGYINTATPLSSTFYTKINIGGSMEFYATATERALVLKWIEQGALNN